jgi:hypothetical protein
VPALRPGELIEDYIVRKGIRVGVDEDGCVDAVRQGKARPTMAAARRIVVDFI